MKPLAQKDVSTFLKQNRVISQDKINEIYDSFDLKYPIYKQPFYPNDIVYQFLRKPSLGYTSSMTGNYFSYHCATKSAVAIIDGLSGRFMQKYQVSAYFIALEGTARKMSVKWDCALGGEGGGTQIFIPQIYLGHLVCQGPS